MKIAHRMWPKVWEIGIVLGLVLSAIAAKAADTPTASHASANTSVFDQGAAPHTLILSAAINQGVSSLTSSTSSVSGSGLQTEILGLATLDVGNWAIEGGGGWLYSSITGGTSGNSGFSSLSLSAYTMSTEAGVAELSPQYRFTDHLQAGPLAEMLFGPNVGFDYNIGGSLQSMALMGGAQGLYGFKAGPVEMHAGARYLTSMNIANQRLQTIQATLQFGLPVL